VNFTLDGEILHSPNIENLYNVQVLKSANPKYMFHSLNTTGNTFFPGFRWKNTKKEQAQYGSMTSAKETKISTNHLSLNFT
jgi:hypothetical protein